MSSTTAQEDKLQEQQTQILAMILELARNLNFSRSFPQEDCTFLIRHLHSAEIMISSESPLQEVAYEALNSNLTEALKMLIPGPFKRRFANKTFKLPEEIVSLTMELCTNAELLYRKHPLCTNCMSQLEQKMHSVQNRYFTTTAQQA